MALLHTKLNMPRVHSDLLERTRLTKRLNEGIQNKLVLISAPAGFGKTTLISSWAATIDKPVVWVSLDDHDNDPLSFWSYFIAALKMLPLKDSDQSNIGTLSLGMLQSQQIPPVESVIRELLKDIEGIPQPFVLILDDYHVISNKEIHDGLALLINNLPPQAHMMISSRTEPPLPLPRWRVRQEMAELNVDNIRFTPDEAEAFLNMVMGLTLKVEDIAHLESLTEGWVAALQLAALSLQSVNNASDFIKSFSGDNRYIFDYFAQEVLNHQPTETTHFLLETSLLERLSGPLCDTMTRRQGSQKILERLEQAHLFIVPLDQKREWYRYHHLFTDFLQSKLEQEYSTSAINVLHVCASLWYEKHGFMVEAVSHALRAQDFELAARFIKQAAIEMFPKSEIIPLLQWLKALPEALVSTDIELSLNYAWALLATVQINAVEPHLRDIEKVLGITEDNYNNLNIDPSLRTVVGQILCIWANIASHQRNFSRALKLAEQANIVLTMGPDKGLSEPQRYYLGLVKFNMALAYELSGHMLAASNAFTETIALEHGTDNPHIFPMASAHLARLHVIQGHLHQAYELYNQTLKRVTNSSFPTPLAGMLRTGLGDIHYEWNELDSAASYYREGIEMGKIWNNWETLLPGYLGLVRVSIAIRNLDNALGLLDELEEQARKIIITDMPLLIRNYRAMILALQGNPEEVMSHLENISTDSDQTVSFIQEPEVIVQLRSFLSFRNPERALELSHSLLASSQSGKRWGRVIEILALQSSSWQSLGECKRAAEALDTALGLAETEGYIRSIIDSGENIIEVLQTIVEKGHSSEYASRLLESLESTKMEGISGNISFRLSGDNKQQGLIEPLSPRELEVLVLLADGKTNQEIANNLFLSPNTIKTHVKNIHTKLGTRNRTEAANRALELHLL